MRPKLRPIHTQPIQYHGRQAVLLRDPLELSGASVIVPAHLAPLLALCDGEHEPEAIRAALAVRAGVRLSPEHLEALLAQLDQALLLDNERSSQALAAALEAYRQAPFRPPASAGHNYPADLEELKQLFRTHLSQVAISMPDQDSRPVRGLVSPHIDYARGGAIYAGVWHQAATAVRQAELVVILGTDHLGSGGRITLTRQHYATPYGILPTAQDVVETLIAAIGPEIALAEELHHRNEHSVELAAVWLHHMREGQPVPVIPVLCGGFEPFINNERQPGEDHTYRAFIETLSDAIANRRTLIVAAADLAHSGPAFGGRPLDIVIRAKLRSADERLLDAICRGDAEGFFQTIRAENDRWNVCGLPPIYLALRLLGQAEGQITGYQHCPADTSGTSVVTICGAVWR